MAMKPGDDVPGAAGALARPVLTRRSLIGLAGLGGAALLGGCEPTGGLALTPGTGAAARPAARAETIGSGPVTVALLVPVSAGGGGGAVATGIRNASDMAMAELAEGEFELLVKDDRGTPAGAAEATRQAIAEGARIILGPLFGPTVAAGGSVARSAGVPMVAFSSDASVAAPGVYLLSFMPQSDVDRIVGYTAKSGKASFAALIPETAYGSVVQGAFQQAAAREGARIVGIERYAADRGTMTEPISRLAPLLLSRQADSLFLPEGGDTLPGVAEALHANGVDTRSIQLVGTGVWEDRRVFADPALEGGLYAAPDAMGFQAFATRYRARYNADPVRLASVGYDGIALVSGLLKAYGSNAFDPAHLTNAAGFSGIDGAFRFRPDGTSERSLAVLKVTREGGRTVSPALRSFIA
jgi:branched-chain amino acid transport system substrate-binding protein